MLNPHQTWAAAAATDTNADAWKSVIDPFPSVTMNANTSSNVSVYADARCGYALKPSISITSIPTQKEHTES